MEETVECPGNVGFVDRSFASPDEGDNLELGHKRSEDKEVTFSAARYLLL